MDNIGEVSHYFIISVYDKNQNFIEGLKWDNLSFELRLKYDWYFKYRSALLQIKYPRYRVETYWGNEPAKGKLLENIRKNKIRAKKAKITEYSNKIEKAIKYWNEIFPIEDDEIYKKALTKLEKLKSELNELQIINN